MRYAAAAAISAIAAALWYKQSKKSKPKKQIIQLTIHYNAVSDKYELAIASNAPTRIIDETRDGLACMSNADYKVRIYTPTNVDQYSIPVILISTINRTEVNDGAICRIPSQIQYMVAKQKQATLTIPLDKIDHPDEFAHHEAYTDVLILN